MSRLVSPRRGGRKEHDMAGNRYCHLEPVAQCHEFQWQPEAWNEWSLMCHRRTASFESPTSVRHWLQRVRAMSLVRASKHTFQSPEPVRNVTVAANATFERHNTAVAYLVPHSGSLPRLGWTLNHRCDAGREKSWPHKFRLPASVLLHLRKMRFVMCHNGP